MRLLVACPKCHRQFDASGRPAGSCFRCHCGAVVKIPLPQHHEAAVVRCASCGAPREEGSDKCRFCGSDFTLHERDLDTVCPKCLARVSNQAKFCHHCGTRLAPESLAADATPLVCPACGEPHHLGNRRLGEFNALECGRCAGLWLGNETFQQLSQRAASQAIEIDQLFDSPHAQPVPPAPTDAAKESAWHYRKCPQCAKIMYRRNYAGSSGVIVDFCRDHGVWFDADELPRILEWIRSGGLDKAKQEQAKEAARQERWKQIERQADEQAAATGLSPEASYMGLGGVLAGSFLDELFGWFHWLR